MRLDGELEARMVNENTNYSIALGIGAEKQVRNVASRKELTGGLINKICTHRHQPGDLMWKQSGCCGREEGCEERAVTRRVRRGQWIFRVTKEYRD